MAVIDGKGPVQLATFEMFLRGLRDGMPPSINFQDAFMVLYVNGMHYAVKGVRMCDSRIEIEWDHGTALDSGISD